MANFVNARSLGLTTGDKTKTMLEHYAAYAIENHSQTVMEAVIRAFNRHRKELNCYNN